MTTLIVIMAFVLGFCVCSCLRTSPEKRYQCFLGALPRLTWDKTLERELAPLQLRNLWSSLQIHYLNDRISKEVYDEIRGCTPWGDVWGASTTKRLDVE